MRTHPHLEGSKQHQISRLAELELELIQTHMAQKPLLWVEVGAHAVRNRSKCGGVGWAVAVAVAPKHFVAVTEKK
jgi:hypothetical protein